MLEFHHYVNRNLGSIILLGIVVGTLLTVFVPIMFSVLEAARELSDSLSSIGQF